MIQENEIVALILALGVLFFTLVYRHGLEDVAYPGILLAAFTFYCVGLILTVLEGLFWPDLLNILEHICHAISSILLGLWVLYCIKRRTVTER